MDCFPYVERRREQNGVLPKSHFSSAAVHVSSPNPEMIAIKKIYNGKMTIPAVHLHVRTQNIKLYQLNNLYIKQHKIKQQTKILWS